jgi:ABC-type glycerol-3-phosphate transport system substrate-binding protein
MDDDVYQRMGLVTLFAGGTPPDVYFQWGGYLVRKYAAAGRALDLTPHIGDRSAYWEMTWPSCRDARGRIAMWPITASVTNIFWYRRSLFAAAGAAPPRTWEELLAACEKLRGAGLIPIAVGNREQWSGGNLGAALAAQMAGREQYDRVLSLAPGTRLDDPYFVRALGLLTDLQSRGYLNRGVNGVGTDDARSLLLQGRAAIHPIGDWLVSEADPEQAEDLDFFPTPHLPGQQGEAPVVLALATGYMVNPRGRDPEAAGALLKHLASAPVQRDWTAHGHMSALRAAAPGAEAPAPLRSIFTLLRETRETALAPDVGFNLEVSDAFYDAVSLVLGGRATAARALAEAEAQVGILRGER